LSVVFISPTYFVHKGSSSGYNSLKAYKKIKYNCIRVTEISVSIILETHVPVSVMLVEILINKIVVIYVLGFMTPCKARNIV